MSAPFHAPLEQRWRIFIVLLLLVLSYITLRSMVHFEQHLQSGMHMKQCH